MINEETACPEDFPERLWGEFKRYVLHGTRPGQYLVAVFEGDLHETARRGGKDLFDELWPAIYYLHTKCPTGCYGSKEHVQEWFKRGGLNGINAE